MPLIHRYTAEWGVAFTAHFGLESPLATSSDRLVTGTIAALPIVAGDVQRSIDGAAVADTTNLPTQVTAAKAIYALVLTATEMRGDQIVVTLVDVTAGAAWRDALLVIQTTNPYRALRRQLAQGGAASAVTLDAAASAVDDFYNEAAVLITGGTGVGQVRVIADYVGATKVATVTRAWGTAPDNTSVFAVIPSADVWDGLEGAEPSVAPAANATFRVIMQWLKRRFYNLVTQTVTTQAIFRDDSVTLGCSGSASDDGVTQSLGRKS